MKAMQQADLSRTKGRLLGIPSGFEAINENLLANSNGHNGQEQHSNDKNMLNLEMVCPPSIFLIIILSDSRLIAGQSDKQSNLADAEQITKVIRNSKLFKPVSSV
jgi:hypothetical protein